MSSRGRAGGSESRTRAGSSAVASVASLHEASRAWQAANPRAPKEVQPGATLKPVRTDQTHEINIAARLSAPYLQNIMGDHQLGAAMSTFKGPDRLTELAQSAGVEPVRTRGGNIDAAKTISRITSTLTNGHYSADFAKTSTTAKTTTTGNRTAAYHEARIAKLRDQLAKAEADYAAYKAAPPKTSGARASNGAKSGGTSKGYEAWRAQAEQLLSAGRHGNSSAPGALYSHMINHRAYAARWRQELQARGEGTFEQNIAATQRVRAGQQ